MCQESEKLIESADDSKFCYYILYRYVKLNRDNFT